MMIKVSVRDFRGVERIDAVCDPILMATGRNGAGKSSLAQAVAAALTGSPIPLPGMTKKDAWSLVRVGADSGAVNIKTETGSAQVTWPVCTFSVAGEPPAASRIAAGVEHLVDMPYAARARYLSALLHALPSRDDLRLAMADREIADDKWIASLWDLIAAQGWDGAHAIRKDKSTELRGRWKQITRQAYGSRIGSAWTPDGWSEDLADEKVEALEAAVAAAKEADRSAIASNAASGALRATLEAEAGKLAERQADVEKATATLAAAEAHEQRMRAERDALPSGDTGQRPTIPCPCGCDPPVRLITYARLTEVVVEKAPTGPAPDNAEELKRVRLARASAEGQLSNAHTAAAGARRSLAAAEASVEASQKAQEELAAMPAPAPGPSATEAEASANLAEKRLAAFRQKTEADAIHRQIAANEHAIDILAAGGLRARKLRDVLELFNSGQLAPLCDVSEWKRVEIAPDMAVTYGGRRYELLSASEQYRTRVVLQVAIARLEQASMVVIDAADILDSSTRSGLLDLLIEAGLPALVALTLSRPEQVPDLARAGLGSSIWIERGIAMPIGDVKKDAA
jgi:hypothetical protein